jgi:hypothetical protein
VATEVTKEAVGTVDCAAMGDVEAQTVELVVEPTDTVMVVTAVACAGKEATSVLQEARVVEVGLLVLETEKESQVAGPQKWAREMVEEVGRVIQVKLGGAEAGVAAGLRV